MTVGPSYALIISSFGIFYSKPKIPKVKRLYQPLDDFSTYEIVWTVADEHLDERSIAHLTRCSTVVAGELGVVSYISSNQP